MNDTIKTNPLLPHFYLEKPNPSRIDKEKIFDKLEKLGDVFNQFLQEINEPNYLYWDKVKFKQIPNSLTAEEAWFLARQFRSLVSRQTPVRTTSGGYFKWIKLPYVDEFLHKIDISTGGQVFASADTLSDADKQKFISRGILEEAIASSQLEGAHTTRSAAKLMITNKREPRNKDEQMILNNYNTIVKIDDDYKNKQLSEDLLFELHRMLTYNTIDKNEMGRYRTNEDNIVVQGQIKDQIFITHIPPDEKIIHEEILRLIDYANDTNDDKFQHPIVKAIFLHFWIGYLHPFVDGNGRLARSIFYWYLLRKNYWTFMYLPISLIIKRAPIQYAMAYLYSEQDNYDATYFFDFNIRKIMQALVDFNDYVSRKMLENKEVDKIVNKNIQLTERQKYLVHYLISENNAHTTVTSHSTLNNVSRQTAAKDIQRLVKLHLIVGAREGKYIKYKATTQLLNMASTIHR